MAVLPICLENILEVVAREREKKWILPKRETKDDEKTLEEEPIKSGKCKSDFTRGKH